MNALAKMEVGGQLGLELDRISKSYRGKCALDDISFVVPKGSLTVILGAAGAGKTTLLRTIAGLETADVGQVFIAGKTMNGREPKDRDVAMIFDNLALYPTKTGFENIANPLVIARLEPEAIDARVQDIAAKLKIAHLMNRLPKTMSGGERQRVALGRAFVRDPSVFLLDEPLSSLDAMLRIELRAELRRLQKENDHTFVLATPDFSEALAIADKIVLIRAGRIVQIAEPQMLYEDPADCDVARFVGAPEINLIPAAFSPAEGGRVTLEGAVFAAPLGLRRGNYANDFEFVAGIRPEHLRLVPAGEGLWCGQIIDTEPLGLKAAVTVALSQNEVRLLTTASIAQSLEIGQRAGLSLNADKLIAFDQNTRKRL